MLLIFYTAIMENWTSMALSNFPRLWDVKSIRPFHGVKMTELSIILLWLQGKPQMLWKCCFIKTYLAPFLSLSGIHKNICTLLQNYFWQMNNVANWRLKGQTDWEGAKITLLFMFLSTQDYWESMTMKHFSTNKMTSITCPGGDLQGEYISRCTCHSVSW